MTVNDAVEGAAEWACGCYCRRKRRLWQDVFGGCSFLQFIQVLLFQYYISQTTFIIKWFYWEILWSAGNNIKNTFKNNCISANVVYLKSQFKVDCERQGWKPVYIILCVSKYSSDYNQLERHQSATGHDAGKIIGKFLLCSSWLHFSLSALLASFLGFRPRLSF